MRVSAVASIPLIIGGFFLILACTSGPSGKTTTARLLLSIAMLTLAIAIKFVWG